MEKQKDSSQKPTLGYLSAAFRVSTHPEAEAAGPRSHVLGVISAFESLGWEVNTFIVGDQMPKKVLTKSSRKVIGRNYWRILAADIIRLLFSFVNAWRAWYTLGYQDMVYERFAVLQSLGWIFKLRGTPWILETSAPFFYEAKAERKSLVLGRLARYLEIKAYKNCNVLVCVSESLKEILLQEADISEDKIVVIPNGVDVDFFSPRSHTPKRIFNGLTVGYVGSLIQWQGLDLLIDVMSTLRAEGYELFLVVVGDGPERERLEKQVVDFNLETNVKFIGQVSREEVPSYIAGFDIGYAGNITLDIGKMYHSPLKLYEYMAMAKPIIASDFVDARSLIQEGQTGYLFEAGNKENLKENLLKAYINKDQLEGMGLQARREIVMHHSWISRVSTLIRSVDRILENNS